MIKTCCLSNVSCSSSLWVSPGMSRVAGLLAPTSPASRHSGSAGSALHVQGVFPSSPRFHDDVTSACRQWKALVDSGCAAGLATTAAERPPRCAFPRS
jgi:hypothetical protein